MAIHRLDPLKDPRWAEFVQHHPHASIFHTVGWLEALQRTYGYEPVAFTTSSPGAALSDGIVFCAIRSWLTGDRLVSLPFSDHCEPIVDCDEQLAEICDHLHRERQMAGWRSIEMRPLRATRAPRFGSREPGRYCLHLLDLRPGLDRLFRAFHEGSVRRKIRRAEREALVYEEGRSELLLREFYGLMQLTRQRHRLPPQPLEWFRHLSECIGPTMTVRIARLGTQPVAGIVTMRHRATMVYKYGASDARFHRVGGMQFLLWRTIQEACARGCGALDLGRSDAGQDGLLTFKDRWGAERVPLTYWRYPTNHLPGRWRAHAARCAKVALGHAPSPWRVAAGKLLYRHVG